MSPQLVFECSCGSIDGDGVGTNLSTPSKDGFAVQRFDENDDLDRLSEQALQLDTAIGSFQCGAGHAKDLWARRAQPRLPGGTCQLSVGNGQPLDDLPDDLRIQWLAPLVLRFQGVHEVGGLNARERAV